MFCYNCGNRIDDNARFCLYCGADQQIDEQPVAPVAPEAPEIPDVPVAPVGRLEDIPPAAPVGETEVLSPEMLTDTAEQAAPQEDVLAQLIQATEIPVVPVETVIPEPVQEPEPPVAPVIPEIPEIPDIPDLGDAPTVVLSPIEPFAPVEPVAPAQPVAPYAPMEPVAPAQPVAAYAPMEPVAPAQPVAAYAPVEPVAPAQPVAAYAPVEPVAPQVPVGQVAVQEPPAAYAAEQPQSKKKKKWPIVVAVLVPLLLVLGTAGAYVGHYFSQGYWAFIEDPAELAAEDLVKTAMAGDFSGIRNLAPTEYWNARADIGQQIASMGQTWQTEVLPALLQKRFQTEGGMVAKSFQPSQVPEIRVNRDLTAEELTLVQTTLSSFYQIPSSRIEKTKCLEVDLSISVKYQDGLKQEMKQEEILYAIKMDGNWYLLSEDGHFAVEQMVSHLSLRGLGQTQ